MKFSEAAQGIHPGDVIMVSGRSLFASAIKLWTGSPWTHAGLAVWLEWGCNRNVLDFAPIWDQLCILEAVGGQGVRLMPLGRYVIEASIRGERVNWFRLDNQGLLRSQVVNHGMRQLGKHYASPRQFLISFGRIIRPLRRLIGLGPQDLNPERFFCSELVAESLAAAGECLPEIPAAMAPGKLAQLSSLKDMGPLEPG